MLTIANYRATPSVSHTSHRSFWKVWYATNNPNGEQGVATAIPTKTKREALQQEAALKRRYARKGWTIETEVTRPANRGG